MRYLILLATLLFAASASAVSLLGGPTSGGGGGGGGGVSQLSDIDDICGANEILERDATDSFWQCLSTPGGGGDAIQVDGSEVTGIGNLINANSTGVTITLTGGSPDTIEFDFDATEIVGTTTWGGDAGQTWVWNAGATDPQIVFGSDSLAITNAATFTHAGNTILTDASTSGGLTTLTGTTLTLGDGGDFDTITVDAGVTDPVLTFDSDSLVITNVATFTADGNAILTDASTSGGLTTLTGTTLTLGDGNDFDTITADAGVTDPVITFDSDSIAFSNAATFTVDGNAILDATSTSAGVTTLTGTTLTLGDGNDFTTITADASAGSDPVITFGDDDIAITAAATMSLAGVLTTDGLTMGANENLTLGAETLDHDGTDFVFSDSISATAISVDTSETPNLLLTDATTSGEGKIAVDDAAGPESWMTFSVDEGVGSATAYLRLDGVAEDIELFSGPTFRLTELGEVEHVVGVVNDDDCTGQQSSWWWDSTDNAFEFCNANSGVPETITGAASFGTIGNAVAASAGDSMTVSDSTTIDFTTTNGSPDDLTAAFDATGVDGAPYVWGNNSTSSWSFDTGGANDVTIAFADDSIVFTNIADFDLEANVIDDDEVVDTLTLDLEASTLTNLAPSGDEMLMGLSSGSGTYLAMPTTGTNGCDGADEALQYNTTDNAWSCLTGLGTGGTINSLVGDDDANPTTGAAVSIDGDANGIDTDSTGAGDTVNITFDPSEVGTNTWGAGAGVTWQWETGAGANATIAFADDSIIITNASTFTIPNDSIDDAEVVDILTLDLDSSTLTDITDLDILVGTGVGTSNWVEISGDATLANTGALTIANDAIDVNKLADDAVDSGEIQNGAVDPIHLANLTKSMYWGAGAISSDGTQCADPTEVTLNSGPKLFSISCADNAASIIYGSTVMPDGWDAGTVTFEIMVWHGTTETITFAGDFQAQCRASGEVPSGTWAPDPVDANSQADVSITTANQIVSATTGGAITPAGTCAVGDMLFWKWTMDAANTDANGANTDILGVKMEFGWDADDS
jgi:hypothetical protein